MSDETDETEVNMPAQWPVIVTLKHPFNFGSQQIASLEFRRGRVGDLKGLMLPAGAVPTATLITIASRLCGHPTQVIEQLDMDDSGEVMNIALGFYATCLRTGKRR